MPVTRTALCSAALILCLAVTAHAQAPLEDTPIPMWIPEGQVRAAVQVGNTLVVGGNFTYVGPPTGPFAIVDAADATNVNTAAGLAGVAGRVVSDGTGGWFVIVERPDACCDNTLVHIAPDGRRDLAFAPPPILTAVSHLAVDGGRLFVAGFAGAGTGGGGQPTILALDPATGASLPWVAAPGPAGAQVTNLVASQGVVYVAYAVTSSQSSGLALDGMTGAVVPFPALQTGEVAAAINDRVYVVTKTGASHTLQAYTRAGAPVGAFTASTYSYVLHVVASSTAVYVVAQDTGPTSPRRVAAFDAASGAATWSSLPADYPGGGPTNLALDGATLYVAGHTQTGSTSRPRARLDALAATTGARLPWAPSVGALISNLAAANGRVAIAGSFQSVGGIEKRGLVSLDLATGRPTLVQPPDSNSITALAASGDLVVAATTFFQPPSPPLPGEIFAYSAATGTRYPRALEAGGGHVASLAITGGTLFIGGGFQSIDGQARRHLAAYNLVTGQVLPWSPNPNDYVYKLKAADSALYVVGRFTALAGAARAGAAAFDPGSLQMSSWDPQVPNIGTYSVDVWQDRVFLGIHVRTDNNLPVMQFVRTIAVDRFSGARLNVDLPYGPIVAQVGGTLAIRNFRQTSPPLPQPGTIAGTIDGVTGQPLPWNPAVEDWSYTQSGDLIGLDGYLVLTESNSVGGRPISHLAVFKPRVVLPGAPRQIQMTVSGSTVSLAWSPGAAPAPLGYVIEAGSAPGLSDLGRFPVGSATQVAAVVAPGSYGLRVRAVGASGEGPASSEWRFTTPATTTAPGAPSGLVTSVAGNVVYLAWTAGAGNATTYVVEGGSAPGLSNLGVIALGSLDTAAAGAVPPGTYYLRVRAANAVGPSAPSNEVVVVVP